MEDFELKKHRTNLAKQTKEEPKEDESGEYGKAEKLKRAEERRPFWGDFSGGETNEAGEYKEPTPEQKEKFQKRNERTAEIFENADFPWSLDGATNISLYKDNQIRDHKDIDFGIFKEDLGKLEKFLSSQGFGIFLNYNENGKELMKRITTEELAKIDSSDLSICKLDQEGKMERKSNEKFNLVDLHLKERDSEGNVVIKSTGTILPKEFFEPIKKRLANGKEINLSHPAIVAYYKLHSNRPYDLIDLKKLRSDLKESDFTMLKDVLQKENENTEKIVKEKAEGVWSFLIPILQLTHDEKVISEKLWQYPELKKRKYDKNVVEYVSFISKYLFENVDVSKEDFVEKTLLALQTRESAMQKLKILNELEKIKT